MFFKKKKRTHTKEVPFVLKDTKNNKYIVAKKNANDVYECTGSGVTDIASATVFSPDANYAKVKIANLPEGTYTIIELNDSSGYMPSANQTEPRSKQKVIFSYIAETIKLLCLACIFIVSMSFIIVFFLLVMRSLFNR